MQKGGRKKFTKSKLSQMRMGICIDCGIIGAMCYSAVMRGLDVKCVYQRVIIVWIRRAIELVVERGILRYNRPFPFCVHKRQNTTLFWTPV